MKSNYQKYYDALKGKDFSSPISKYKTAVSDVKTKVDSTESIINSSSWVEKGLEIIKSSVFPSFKEQLNQLENGLDVLSSAVSKIQELVSKLEELEEACNRYDSCEEKDKSSYASRIDSLESSVDSLISSINGLSLDFSSSNSSFSSIMTNLKDSTSIETKRKEFIGDVNDTSKYFIDPNYPNCRKDLRLFDNETGEEITNEQVIHMKVGETKVFTVAVPFNAGAVKRIIRTTAADNSGQGDKNRITSSKSDINPDPNVVDYVNYQSQYNHWPKDVDLHTNYYEWIVTAERVGKREISQTCEYESTAGIPKSMIGIIVDVTE